MKRKHETQDKNHRRLEIRRYWTVKVTKSFKGYSKWKKLNCIGMVEAERDDGQNASSEHRFYITSLECDAKQFAQGVCSHWGIENS